MKKYGYLFPGQGAQFVGMGKDLARSSTRSADLFRKADEVLGFELSKICFEGPEEELTKTDVSQPAIYAASAAALEALREKSGVEELPAAVTAGLSLGEYSALYFAGSISFEDGLRLVRRRGCFMQKACDAKPGAMASIIGLDHAAVEEIVDQVREDGVLVAANYNSPVQVAISGDVELVEKAAALAKEKGAKRAIVLTVAGAFHSVLMDPAAEELIPYIKETRFREPRIPFYSNVTGRPNSDPDEIRDALIRQVNNPVRWSQSIDAIVEAGNTEFLEVGPGNVLAGLMRRSHRECDVTPVLSPDTIEKAVENG